MKTASTKIETLRKASLRLLQAAQLLEGTEADGLSYITATLDRVRGQLNDLVSRETADDDESEDGCGE